MKAVIQEDPGISDRSEIVVTLIMTKCSIPGLTVDVCSIVCAETPPPSSFIEDVIIRLQEIRNKFKSWYARYQVILQNLDMKIGGPNHDSHCKVYANYIACLLITSRILAAISPQDRRECEEVAQNLAHSMLDLEDEMKSSPTALFTAQTSIAARVTIDTREAWRVMGDDEDGSYTDTKGLIERRKLEEWATNLGVR
jgi:hypothetical protein